MASTHATAGDFWRLAEEAERRGVRILVEPFSGERFATRATCDGQAGMPRGRRADRRGLARADRRQGCLRLPGQVADVVVQALDGHASTCRPWAGDAADAV
jgi:hypothetical protein